MVTNKINLLLSLIFLFLTIACTPDTEVYQIGEDRELIPEGIAIYPEKSTLYISSIHKDKIVEYNLKTGHTQDLISTGQYGYKHGIGIEIKKNLLFALSSETIDGKSSSMLLVYDLDEDQFVKKFKLRDTVSHFMNDLAISDQMEVYITDTERHMVYKLDYPDGEIIPYLQDTQISYPNGIAISDLGDLLFVDSYSEGIRIVDLVNGQIVNTGYSNTDKLVPVDGLKYYEGHLYGIKNGDRDKGKHSFMKFELVDNKRDIGRMTPLLTAHPKMDIPTTFCISDANAYILANSQLDKLNQVRNEISVADSLNYTYVIKLKL